MEPGAWDALVDANNPFVEHAFLHGLEKSGSVGDEQTGWIPRHLLVHRGDMLVGAMPLYLKLDSYGEYIFDWAWARGAHGAGSGDGDEAAQKGDVEIGHMRLS